MQNKNKRLARVFITHLSKRLILTLAYRNICSWEPKVAKIKHTRNENGKNFTHQNKTTLFWRKKAKINLHQNFPFTVHHLHVTRYPEAVQIIDGEICDLNI
jgi:hypothetical protein